MSYPNYGSTTAGYPAPSSGVGTPSVVVLSGSGGTGPAQQVTRNADGAGATGGAYGSIVAEQMRGPEYVAGLIEGGTLQLVVTLKDSQGATATAGNTNTVTYRSLNAAALSQASFRPLLPNEEWLPNRVAPSVPAGQVGPGAGNGLVWESNVCTVSASGLVTSTGEEGYAIIEVRYPRGSGSSVNDFIYALLLVTVSEGGTDVE